MLHILLVILKIIGILLAVILGLLIVIVLCILFAPLRYKAEAEAAGNVESVKAEGRASWLFHLVSAYITYEKQTLDWRLRIAWKTYSGQEETLEDVSEEERQEEVQADEPKESQEAPQAVVPEEERQEAPQADEPEEESQEAPQAAVPEEISRESASDEEMQRQKKRIREKPDFKRFFQRIEYTFHSICDKIKALSDKGKSLEKTKENIQAFIDDEVHRYTFYKVKDELFKLLKKVRPSRIQAYIHFGTNDPYVTGQILAVLAVIYPFLGEGFTVQPDFENQVLEGSVKIKGKMRVIYFIAPAIRLFFDSQVKATYRDIKALKK